MRQTNNLNGHAQIKMKSYHIISSCSLRIWPLTVFNVHLIFPIRHHDCWFYRGDGQSQEWRCTTYWYGWSTNTGLCKYCMVLPKRNSAALCRTSVSHQKCRSLSKLALIPYLYDFFMETQLSIPEGSLTELLRFWFCQFQKLRSRRISSFLELRPSVLEEVSQNCFVLELCTSIFLRRSRRIASFQIR